MTRADHRRPPARAARRQQRPRRSGSGVRAAIVAGAALATVVAFILTKESSTSATDEGPRLSVVPNGGAAAPAATPSTAASINSAKADRKPPTSTAPAAPKGPSSAPVDTGPTSPVFRSGQWIVVLDKYPTDVGMGAESVAKATAAKLVAAGVPAKTMLVDGQYPGLTNSASGPWRNTWVVYLGPGASSVQMLNLCSDPKTQRAYNNPACPTYEPAVAPGS